MKTDTKFGYAYSLAHEKPSFCVNVHVYQMFNVGRSIKQRTILSTPGLTTKREAFLTLRSSVQNISPGCVN